MSAAEIEPPPSVVAAADRWTPEQIKAAIAWMETHPASSAFRETHRGVYDAFPELQGFHEVVDFLQRLGVANIGRRDPIP